MTHLLVKQTAACSSFVKTRDKNTAVLAVASAIGLCFACAASRPADCRFFKREKDGRKRILEQRTFKVSPAPEHRITEVIPFGNNNAVRPQFKPAPPQMTSQMVWETLKASASILIPELERHELLRREFASTIWRTPQLDDHRSICDACQTSLLCCVRSCKYCGYEACDQCTQEGRVANAPCTAPRAALGHDLALIEFFQPGELEEALQILRQMPHPDGVLAPREAEVIRVRLSDRAGAPEYSTLYQALATGIPLVVQGVDPGERNLTPEYFLERHGHNLVTVVNTKTGARRSVLLRDFMANFRTGDDPEVPEKLQDWPPTANFPDEFPDMFRIFEDCLTGSWLTSREGPLNLEASMPRGSNPPDTGPKAYLAHSAGEGTTTRLHCDVTDAINTMFYAEPRDDDSEGGALWTMIHRDDMALVERLLRVWKAGDFQGHPIHSQQLHLTPKDVEELKRQGVRIWTFVQRQGETVFIPAGVGHQVTNLSACIKVAVDFVAPCNVKHAQKISEELRQHRLDRDDTEAEDILQLPSMCWWAFKRSQTNDLRGLRSDPASNPWCSPYSAAPGYLPVIARPSTHASGSTYDEPASHDMASDGFVLDGPSLGLAFTPESPLIPSPSPSQSQPPPSTSTIPAKRSNDEEDDDDDDDATRTQIRRKYHLAKREANSQEDPKKTLSCPIGVSGRACSQPRKLFSRQGLVNHLEDNHTVLVQFRQKGYKNKKLGKTRRAILSTHVGNDLAFIAYIKEHVLGEPSASE